MARYIFCMVEFQSDVEIVQTSRFSNLTELNGYPTATYSDNQGVIHASTINKVLGSITIKRAAKGTPLSLSVSCCCEERQKSFSPGQSPRERRQVDLKGMHAVC